MTLLMICVRSSLDSVRLVFAGKIRRTPNCHYRSIARTQNLSHASIFTNSVILPKIVFLAETSLWSHLYERFAAANVCDNADSHNM